MNTKIAPIDEGRHDLGDEGNCGPNIEGATNAERETVNSRQVRRGIFKRARLADQAAISQRNGRHPVELDVSGDTARKDQFEIRREILLEIILTLFLKSPG